MAGRRIVLGVAGSIAAVRAVELARLLIRHGADVHAVMSPAAGGIVTPDALEFATGHAVATRLTGQVEHVTWLGEEGSADLLLVAPATANTIAKIALGIDDTPVTTCAQVAIGAGRPVLVAPAMHGVMESNPATQEHVATLKRRGVRFVEPLYEEGKAKLALEAVTAEVLRALGPRTLAGKRVLLVTGRSEEPLDPVRVLTNRSSGRTGHALADALHRHGADLTVVSSADAHAWPAGARVEEFSSLESLARLLPSLLAAERPDWVLVPAALADFLPEAAPGKLASDEPPPLRLKTAPKLLPLVREHVPEARIVAWKLEDTVEAAVAAARRRIAELGIDAVVANSSAALAQDETEAVLVLTDATVPLAGAKADVAERLVVTLAERLGAARPAAAGRGKPRTKRTTA